MTKAESTDRRGFLGLLGAAAATLAGNDSKESYRKVEELTNLVRPPGASDDFLSKCIRCFKCGEACPYDCISFGDREKGISFGTPYVLPRQQPCFLCQGKDSDFLDGGKVRETMLDIDPDTLRCGEACPTGALEEIPNAEKAILERTSMGTAVIDRSECIAWTVNNCDRCVKACPFDEAISMNPGIFDVNLPGEQMTGEEIGEALSYMVKGVKPEVHDACNGCGICEYECPVGDNIEGEYPHAVELPDTGPAAITIEKEVP